MLDKDALKLFARRLDKTMPVQPSAPLPSDLLRLVQALRERQDDDRRSLRPTRAEAA
jgi:hypothetical protein